MNGCTEFELNTKALVVISYYKGVGSYKLLFYNDVVRMDSHFDLLLITEAD